MVISMIMLQVIAALEEGKMLVRAAFDIYRRLQILQIHH
jgi:hypothetical protein